MRRLTILIIFTLLLCVSISAQTDSGSNGNTNTESAESETKTKKAVFRPTKDQVQQAQIMLREKGTYESVEDGKYNKDLRKAIKEFQGKNGLKKTGSLNRATLEKMNIELTDQQKEIPIDPSHFAGADDDAPKTRKKAFRPTKAQITEAQTKLKDAGMFDGEATGKYSDEFRDVLKTYQESNGLDKTGRLDEATLEKMDIELTDKQKGIETADMAPKRKVFRPTKEQITAAQEMLKENGSFEGEATGKYTNEFRAAIRDYQSANGLKRKGSLNRATLEKMGIEITESQEEIPVNPDDYASADDDDTPKKRGPVFRATKEQITQVQTMLKDAGLYNGEVTGKFNDDFRASIKEWQETNGVKKTGTLNKVTLEAMKIELTDKQKAM